jgi:hypothetical protein
VKGKIDMSTETTAPANEPTEAMLRRVQALLAKASDDAATPEESETYIAKATELMAKYGIVQAMLNAAKPAGQRERPIQKSIHVLGPYAMEKRTLLGQIGDVFGVKSVHVAGRTTANGLLVYLFGYPGDIERVESLFASLTLQAIRDVMRADVPFYENKAAWRRSFLNGFSSAVGHRLKQTYGRAREEAVAATPGTALVLANRDDEVETAYRQAFPDARARRRRLSGGGGRDGRASGKRADIGQSAAGGGRRQVGR